MARRRKKLGEILVGWNVIAEKALADAVEYAQQNGKRIGEALIELELPEDRCATFPLWIWETIYTGHYVAFTRAALDDWYRELRSAVPDRDVWPLPQPWRTQLESSWELMLDRSVDQRCWYRDGELPDEGDDLHILMRDASEEVAALTQELLARDTVDVTLFTAAS